MSEYFRFLGVEFVAVLSDGGENPHWKPKVEATDRALIGTDRFERSIRSRVWSMEVDLWIEPSDRAKVDFITLQRAYADGTGGGLTLPGDPPPPIVEVILVAFDVSPRRAGIDGYRGKVVFGCTEGAPL